MRVLLATDGSRYARAATEYLAAFPLPPGTEIVALSVVPPMPSPIEVPIPPEIEEAAFAEARAAADDAARVLNRRWPDTTTRVVQGDPRQIVPETAKTSNADLVVVGARGLGPVRRLMLGSVSMSVVHHAPCPVLVVRGDPRPLGRVVVAIDGSQHAVAAARYLAALPLPRTLEVALVAVVERPYVPRTAPRRVASVLRAAVDEMVAEQRSALGKAVEEIAPAFEPTAARVDRTVSVGSPADVILEAAKEADLVVVGARGLGPIERLFLGSVSERVLHHAPCSVLVVRHGAR